MDKAACQGVQVATSSDRPVSSRDVREASPRPAPPRRLERHTGAPEAILCPRCGSPDLREVENRVGHWYLGCVDCGFRSAMVTDAFTGPEDVIARYDDHGTP